MLRDSNLKIAGLMSLGIHLLFVVAVSGAFRNADTHRTAMLRPVRVTLVPLEIEEKPNPRKIVDTRIIPPAPFKIGKQDLEELSRDFKRLEEPTSAQPSMWNNIAPEKFEAVSKKDEEEEAISRPAHTAIASGPASGTDLNPGNGGDGNSKELSRNAFSYVSSGSGSGNNEGGGSGAGYGSGSGNGSPGHDGSGRGTGTYGQFTHAPGGGNGARPRYAQNPKPNYPLEAREKGYEGEVILRVEVLPNGKVGQIAVKDSSGYELLDRSALTAVKQWKFVPAKKGDAPIPLWVNIPIKFQLQ